LRHLTEQRAELNTTAGPRVARVVASKVRISMVFPLAFWWLLTTTAEPVPSGEEILARVAQASLQHHAIRYCGLRKYRLRNLRFAKEATVFVQVTYGPGEGKSFKVQESSGSVRVIGIVERLLASEAAASGLAENADHEISPANYRAQLRGTEALTGRTCYVIDLTPKHKSKYLINGTIWVDTSSYGIVRLDGSTSASVSLWLGRPQITEEFTEIAGLWLPSYTRSVSSGVLLGTSELEIQYTDYQIRGRIMPTTRSVGQPPSVRSRVTGLALR
jgi:hypothetical protein